MYKHPQSNQLKVKKNEKKMRTQNAHKTIKYRVHWKECRKKIQESYPRKPYKLPYKVFERNGKQNVIAIFLRRSPTFTINPTLRPPYLLPRIDRSRAPTKHEPRHKRQIPRMCLSPRSPEVSILVARFRRQAAAPSAYPYHCVYRTSMIGTYFTAGSFQSDIIEPEKP